MKKCALFLLLLVSSITPCRADEAENGWSNRELVSLYFHNSEPETQCAWQALSSYKFQGNERVLDFGSGAGNLAAMISFMVPDGQVTGVDFSEEMVEFSTRMFPVQFYKNLRFLKTSDTDFTTFSAQDQFDLVTSFSVLQLVANPTAVLKNIRRKMKASGKLVITLPIGGNQAFLQVVQEQMKRRGWQMPVPGADSEMMKRPDSICQILKTAGFEVQKIGVIDMQASFASIEEMIDWAEGNFGPAWNLPEEDRRDFFADVVDHYLTLSPQDLDHNGFTSFPMKRVDLVATLC